jgi:hypothetical protein
MILIQRKVNLIHMLIVAVKVARIVNLMLL